jgi:predicted Zn-dependent protease
MTNFKTQGSTQPSNQGVITHDSLPTGRAFAQISVTSVSVVAKTDSDIRIEFPLNGLKLHWGGANNKLLFLSHPTKPGWSIFTRDRSLLAQLQATGAPHLSKELSVLKQHSRRNLRRSVYALVSIIALLATSILLWKPFVATCAYYIPFSWEKKLGEAVFLGIKQETTIIQSEELNKEFKKLLEPLTAAVGPISNDLQFYLAKSDTLNAFALPGGKVVVNSKTILEAGRLEELFGVLAHEISHVTQRHTARQIITVLGVYTAVDIVLGSGVGTVAAISQGASYLLQQGFSRDQERDADRTGLAYLHAAQIDPNGMIEFFQRIQEEHDKNITLSEVEKALSFLSTHPATADRIAELRDLIKSTPSQSYRTLDAKAFDTFKAKLRAELEKR